MNAPKSFLTLAAENALQKYFTPTAVIEALQPASPAEYVIENPPRDAYEATTSKANA
jgi:hypothetical protein